MPVRASVEVQAGAAFRQGAIIAMNRFGQQVWPDRVRAFSAELPDAISGATR
jgi:hypothetical protein